MQKIYFGDVKDRIRYHIKSYYLKLLMTYILFIVLAVVLIYSITVYYFLPIVNKQVLNNNTKILEQIMNSFDDKYEKIDEASMLIYDLDFADTNQFLKMREEKSNGNIVNVYELQKEWDGLFIYMDKLVEDLDAVLFIPDEGHDISYSSKYQPVNFSYGFSEKEWFKKIYGDGNRKLKMLGGNTQLDYYIGRKSGIITFSRNIFRLNEKMPMGMILINISNSMFEKMAGFFDKNYIKDFIVTDEKGYIYYSRNNELYGKRFSNYKMLVTDISKESGYFKYVENHKSTFCYYYKSNATGCFFIYIITEEQLYKDSRTFKKFILMIILFFLLAGLILSYYSSRSRYKPIKQLLQSMKDVEKGVFKVKLEYNLQDEMGAIIQGFNKMVEKLKDYIDVVYISQIKKQEATFCALKSQVDAHFICNVMEVIRFRALEHNDVETAEVSKLLGRFYRERLGLDDDLIDMENEILLTKTYIKIEEYRKDCKISFDVDVPKEFLKCMIAKFTFQPVVENSIKHGCIGKKEIEISIKARYCDHVLEIQIGDNGAGIEEDKLKEILANLNREPDFSSNQHIGLRNVNNRIKMYFGENYGIQLQSSCKGTTVFITIPANGGNC